MKKKLALFLALTILGGCRNPKPAVLDIINSSDPSDIHQTETVFSHQGENMQVKIPESIKNENESDRNSDDHIDHNQTHPTEQISTKPRGMRLKVMIELSAC